MGSAECQVTRRLPFTWVRAARVPWLTTSQSPGASAVMRKVSSWSPKRGSQKLAPLSMTPRSEMVPDVRAKLRA